MITSNRPARKRQIESKTIDEPPSRRIRRDVTTSELETIKAELEHERSLRALDAKRAQQLQQRLERQVEFAVEEAKEAKTLLEEIGDESENHIEQLREARKEALMELRECQLQLEEERTMAATEALEEDPKCARLEAELDAQEEENDMLREQFNELKEELAEVSQGQRKSVPPDENEAPGEGASSQAPPEVLRELNRVRINLAEAERKNRQFRRAAEEYQKKAKQLVHERETAQAATARVKHVEKELRDLNEAHESTLAEMKSWKDFGKSMEKIVVKETSHDDSIPDIPPEVTTVKRFLDESQKRAEDAETARIATQKKLEMANETISKLEILSRESAMKESRWTQERKDMESKVEQSNRQLHLLNAREQIWKREADSLRSLVKSFDDLPLSPMKSSASLAPQGSLRALEVSLETSREEINVLKEAQERMQSDLDASSSSKEELQNKHNTVMEKFGKLREAVYAEREKVEKAEARACQAESLAGKGSFDPEQTRVLHLKRNPLMEAFKEEVAVLRRQVEALSGDKSKVVAPDVDPNKLHQRLKESFKEQIGRFREGVYLMTGYKVDMIPGNDRPMFRVRSIFAEREEDHLMLKWPDGDNVSSLDILNTDMAKVLTTTPSYDYMTKFHSLPAFMASVQLSLFEKQTMM
jgi:mitotic spindle assembly checkpoint protein MAD1